ncbi:MAG: hypothetical protein A2Y65_03350 [Deltaproteobacteria bacterium RBG_13_52_11]|nr:MAG: hypothetical protein A2Y65_03350 [Deltaproteobacteria bacterium RBG_13_52_11]
MDRPEPIRILYIEDDPGLARLVQKRLGKTGYTVDIASDGEEGIAKYTADSYDVVFVDQTLPIYDGLQVIRILASRGPLPPMIMITGTGDEKVAVEAMKLGTSDYIVKDVEGGYLNLLPSVIEKVLQQRCVVDEKQRAEEELQKERETFFSMLHKAPYGAILIDKDGTNRYINPEFTAITGYTLKNIPTGKDWFRAAYPGKAYRQQVIEAWKRDFARKKADRLISVVFSVVCKDGGVKEIEFRPNWLDDGQAIVMLADITERRRAEEALRGEQEKFQNLVEESPLGVSIIGKGGHFKYINPTFTEIFGYAQEDIPTRREWFAKAYPDEEYRNHVVATWIKDKKKTKCGESRPNAFTVTCKDGSKKVIYFRPITMETGDEFVTYEDITDRVRADEALRESGDKLEKLHEVARRLAACMSEEEVYHVAVDAAKRILTFSFCSLGIVEGKQIVTKVADPHPFVDETQTMSVHEGLTGTTYRNGKTHVLREIRKGVQALSPHSQYLSLVSAPIGDLGVFQAASIEPDAFSKNDTRLLELLLGHTAAAIKRIRLQNELKEQAIHDHLTGLHNRYYLDKVLEQEIKRSKRYNHSMAFMMLDVNRFKEINDRYGHQMGDEILREVAVLLREAVRETDIVVRYGGDEFLIILLETNGELDSIKRRIAEKVALLNMKDGQMDFPVTLSIGSASWGPKDHRSVDEIMNEADRRMYEEKKQHNGHVKGINHA